MTGTAAGLAAAPTVAPADPDGERAVRRRYPTARPWRTDPERLRRRLAEVLVAQGHTPGQAAAEASATAREAAHRRPTVHRPG